MKQTAKKRGQIYSQPAPRGRGGDIPASILPKGGKKEKKNAKLEGIPGLMQRGGKGTSFFLKEEKREFAGRALSLPAGDQIAILAVA